MIEFKRTFNWIKFEDFLCLFRIDRVKIRNFVRAKLRNDIEEWKLIDQLRLVECVVLVF